MRLLGPEDGCKQVTVANRTFNRAADGTFHLPPSAARQALASGDFTHAHTRTGEAARGFVCADCGFAALIRDHCGRCGGSNLDRG